MGIDHYDILAVCLGIFLTFRRLDARSRTLREFPQVGAADFERWKRSATGAYALGSAACFARVVFHFGFVQYAKYQALEPRIYMRTALIVDLAWWAALIVCFLRARGAARLRRELGIALDVPPAS